MSFKLPEKWKNFFSKIFTKEKLPLFLLFGMLLIVICLPVKPSKKSNGVTDTAQKNETAVQPGERNSVNDYVKDTEKRLEKLLSQGAGVGKVSVMISVKNSGRSNPYVQKNVTKSRTEENDSAGGSRSIEACSEQESVVYTNTGGSSFPYVTDEEMPEIRGVVIIAEGAGDARVVSDITEAASALLGISVNKIKVLKMEV